MSASLSPSSEQGLQLRHTNVSNPSVIHRAQSEQSISASEDYYSLSSASSRTIPAHNQSQHSIHRFQTPPSRYRTPLQSRDNLVATNPTSNDHQSPLRGTGQRRQSLDNEMQQPAINNGQSYLRDGGVRRKPVPSTVMETSELGISPVNARSSAALNMARERSPPTPDVDDTPFIRFALDQLTRDEEVRGSRTYAGPNSGTNFEPQYPTTADASQQAQHQREQNPSDPLLGRPEASRVPPPRNPNRPMSSTHVPTESKPLLHEPDVFLPLAANATRPLDFRPGILRPLAMVLFLCLLLVYLILLIIAAIWSIVRTGLWDYGTLGDSRYFVFQYLPTLLGMILLLWLFQIQSAVTRTAPFIAMSSNTPRLRHGAPDLPLYTGGFLLPKFRYFRVGMHVVGFFMLVAWLQLFTIPLLASSFNVYFVNESNTEVWRWTAVQGVIWTAIALYVFLFVAIVTLLVYLGRLEETGLKWDPRSLADIVVMLERSNALEEHTEMRRDPARLGYWRTSGRPNEVFHTFGHTNAEPRRYGVEEGRIREKHATRESGDTDLEANRWRHSKTPMLGGAEGEDGGPAMTYPWYLRFPAALLWAVLAFVLLLAFLIVSYNPSTSIVKGFLPGPGLPTIVNDLGFGADNFLFSFVPTVIAMLCLLLWMKIDFAFRRFQPLFSLMKPGGDLAEHSLLLSYTADFPIVVTAAAAANGHWRVAWFSFITLMTAALPILAGGVFWAQFSIPEQIVRIYPHVPAYYALSAFLVLCALSYFLVLPLTHTERALALHAPRDGHSCESFADILALVRNSRMLDDFAFHGPVSKVGLVTRLLSIQPGASVEPKSRISTLPEAGTSMLSLADSVRGFGNARQKAIGGSSASGIPKYGLARWNGRDGAEFWGIDRFR